MKTFWLTIIIMAMFFITTVFCLQRQNKLKLVAKSIEVNKPVIINSPAKEYTPVNETIDIITPTYLENLVPKFEPIESQEVGTMPESKFDNREIETEWD